MDLKANFQKYFDENILTMRDLKHNGNNQLLDVQTLSGRFILKKYAKFHMDNWQRGKTEFKALNYLWEKGFREIPEPFRFYEQENIGIYSYEEGRILKATEVKERDIIQMTNFLIKLHDLKNEDKINFSPASSACLNLKEYINVLDRRVGSLFNYELKDAISKRAKSLFDKKIIPKIEELKTDFYQKTKKYYLEKELITDEQVLTQGDLGFHNILYHNGQYKFIDFEYFGRDDPARQVLEFLHHAQSSDIKPELKELFLKTYKENRKISQEFEQRLKLANPLIAMDWVLIYLNVFCKNRIENLDLQKEGSIKALESRLFNAEKKLKEV